MIWVWVRWGRFDGGGTVTMGQRKGDVWDGVCGLRMGCSVDWIGMDEC